MKQSGEKRKESERDDSCSDEPANKAARLSVEVDSQVDKPENASICSEPGTVEPNQLPTISESTEEGNQTLPSHVMEWSETHYELICKTFNIQSVVNKTNIVEIISEFPEVQPNDKYVEYISSLRESFAPLDFTQVANPDSDEHRSDSSILSEDVLKHIVRNLRSSKETLSSNQFSRYVQSNGIMVSFLFCQKCCLTV